MDKVKARELIEQIRVVGDPSDKGKLCDELSDEIGAVGAEAPKSAAKEEKPKKKGK